MWNVSDETLLAALGRRFDANRHGMRSRSLRRDAFAAEIAERSGRR
jgi:hypothetical protein